MLHNVLELCIVLNPDFGKGFDKQELILHIKRNLEQENVYYKMTSLIRNQLMVVQFDI